MFTIDATLWIETKFVHMCFLGYVCRYCFMCVFPCVGVQTLFYICVFSYIGLWMLLCVCVQMLSYICEFSYVVVHLFIFLYSVTYVYFPM